MEDIIIGIIYSIMDFFNNLLPTIPEIQLYDFSAVYNIGGAIGYFTGNNQNIITLITIVVLLVVINIIFNIIKFIYKSIPVVS